MGQCMECGGKLEAAAKVNQTFCSAKCRVAFNNRRVVRGMELYDLFMALRYDRANARTLQVWTFICRVAQFYFEEDQRERAGRRSWNDPATVIGRKPWLKAKVFKGIVA